MSLTCQKTGGEYKTAERTILDLNTLIKYNKIKLNRIKHVFNLPEKLKILELGCSSGGNIIAWQRLGYDCVGLEPSEIAIGNSHHLANAIESNLPIYQGMAENIPFRNDLFDLVNANSVIEHVQNVDDAISEVYRVLKPGGIFWFNAASSMCPKQDEIRGFPFFGWYPNTIKQHILLWAKQRNPKLIGHTSYPAVNWFTSQKARKLLLKHGFINFCDRWDLRTEDEGGTLYKRLLPLIRSNNLTKFITDIFVPGCSYSAMK